MKPMFESEPNRAFVLEILEAGGHGQLAESLRDALATPDPAATLPAGNAAAICDELERVAVDPASTLARDNTMDFATYLRVLVGGVARKGAPFEWRQGNNGFWHATDSRGTSWDIGPGSLGVGVTVAEWDRPDWWVDTIEQGKAVAEEVAARPSFPRELWVEEHLIGDI